MDQQLLNCDFKVGVSTMANLKSNHNNSIGNQRQPRYSIRKLTIGTASCLIGYFLFMPTTTVKAADHLPAAVEEQLAAIDYDNQNNAIDKVSIKDDQAEVSLPIDKTPADADVNTATDIEHETAASVTAEKTKATNDDATSSGATDKTAASKKEDAGNILIVGDGADDYHTLHEAVDHAHDGDTISIEKDTQETETTIIDKDLTLLGQNKDIIFDDSSHLEIAADKNVVFGSTDENQGVTVKSKHDFTVYGHLTTYDSFTYVCENPEPEKAKLKVAAGGRLDVEGGTFSPAYVEYQRGSTGSIHGGNFFNNKRVNNECLFIDGDVYEITGGSFSNDLLADDTNNTRAAVYIQGHVGIISGGTFLSEKSNALNIIHGGHVDEISGGTFTTHSPHNQHGYALAMMSNANTPVSYVNKISGGVFNGQHIGIWIFSYYGGQCYIGEISGGTFIGGQAGIQNDIGSKIGKISGGIFQADSAGLFNVSQIDEISGGQFTGTFTGGIWNYDSRAQIDLISGGQFSGSSGINNKGTIDRITGGEFTGNRFYGLRNQSVINTIDGGRFIGRSNGVDNTGRLSQITNGVFWGKQSYGIDNHSQEAIILEPGLQIDPNGLGIGNARYLGQKDALRGEFSLPGDYHMSSRETVLPVKGIDETEFRFLKEYLTLSYDPNGGTGTMNSQTETEDSQILTIADNGFIYPDYEFVGWNTKADGSGTVYQPGDTIVLIQNTTLYAQWQTKDKPQIPELPEIPETPEIPSKPEEPIDPVDPDKPAEPDRPIEPGHPTDQAKLDKLSQQGLSKKGSRKLNQINANKLLPQTGFKLSPIAILSVLLVAGISSLNWRKKRE
jgi:co-chaperonin GroES (HSP10)